jgi:hypothetical protein
VPNSKVKLDGHAPRCPGRFDSVHFAAEVLHPVCKRTLFPSYMALATVKFLLYPCGA